ncbi:hypothetical protein HS7_08460 [Sulfolobales archaeon HS-7]|nr:hypothetical protein HS7_08460 [Sulfolobales archaeon HS-7]
MIISDMMTFDKEEFFEGVTEKLLLEKPIKNSINKGINDSSYIVNFENIPRKAFAVIGIEGRTKQPKTWRIWINDFSITKEFKPNILVNHNKKLYFTAIYDISPIITTKNVMTVSYSDEIKILYALVFSTYLTEGFTTEYEISAGTTLLDNNKGLNFTSKGRVYAVVAAKGIIKLRNNGEVIWSSNVNGLEELDITTRGNNELSYESTGKYHEPGFLFVVCNEKIIVPNINFDVLKINEDNAMKLIIKNTGNVKLDNVIVTTLENGVSKSFRKYEQLKVGDEVHIEIKKNGMREITVRIVGKKANFHKIKDIKI